MDVEIFKIDEGTLIDLFVYVLVAEFFRIVDVSLFKGKHAPVCVRNNKICKEKREYPKHKRGDKIGEQHAPKTNATAQDGDDLRIRCHAGGKKDNRDEGEQVTEKVNEIRNEVEVIIKYDCLKRSIMT